MIKLFEALREGGIWKHIDLINISEADRETISDFKKVLDEKNIHYEESGNGNFNHFEISCKSHEEDEFVDAFLREKGVDPYGYELQESKTSIEDMVVKMKRFVDDKAVNKWGFDNPEDAFLNVYSEKKEGKTIIWLVGEFTYKTMSELADDLDKILKDCGYPESYFDAESSGRWCAVIWE